MKSTITLIVLFFCFAAAWSTVSDGRVDVKYFEPQRTAFNGILETHYEYSQEEYGAGDIAEITIHFKVIKELNVFNLKFAVVDPALKDIYLIYNNRMQTLTEDDLERTRAQYIEEHGGIEPAKSKDTLILSNEKPEGKYVIRTKIYGNPGRKIKGSDDELYPYFFDYIDVYSFTKAIYHTNITEYPGKIESISIPVKLSESLYEKED